MSEVDVATNQLTGPSFAVAPAIAAWSAKLSPDEIPPIVIQRLQDLVLDVTGVALAALGESITYDMRVWASNRPAGISTTPLRSTEMVADDAALANGTLMHALDFDDFGYGGHATCVTLSAVLAVADEVAATGSEILTAYAVAMEVYGRLSRHAPSQDVTERGWHPTSVFGVIAATAGVGRLLGLEPDVLANALAIAASSGAGLTVNFGTDVKPLHAGMAAAAGVRAARLAEAGIGGQRYVFEGAQGFGFAYLGGDVDWHAVVRELGSPFRVIDDGPSIKLYPCCGGNHRLLENLRVAIDQFGSRDSIRHVKAHVSPELLHVLRYDWPESVTEARFSAAFSLAAMLVNGTCGLDSYTSNFLSSPSLALARKRVEVVPDLAGPVADVALEVTDSGGNVHRFDDNQLPGTPARPLSRARIEQKFLSNASISVPAEDVDIFMRSVPLLDPSMEIPWTGWRDIAGAASNLSIT